MAVPRPTWWREAWYFDARPWNGPNRVLLPGLPPPPGGEIPALHAAYAAIERYRARPTAQLSLLDRPAGATFRTVAVAWQKGRKYGSPAGRTYVAEKLAVILPRIGDVPVTALTGPRGVDALAKLRDWLRREKPCRGGKVGVGPKQAANLLTVVGQVLAYAADSGHIDTVPRMPSPSFDGEEFYTPDIWNFINEPTFRALRENLLARPTSLSRISTERGWSPDRARVYVEQRRLYISLGYYTGMRRADLDGYRPEFLSVDIGRYRRRAQKTKSKDALKRMPPPLHADVRAFAKATAGFRFARHPEHAGCEDCSVTGGPWPKGGETMSAAAERVGLTYRVTANTLRHSYVYAAFLGLHQKGISGREAIAILKHQLGHRTDSAMVEDIYLKVPEIVDDELSAVWPTWDFQQPDPARVVPLRLVE